MENSISTFGLTENQMVILCSLQCYITKVDADQPAPLLDGMNPLKVRHALKTKWRQKCIVQLNNFFKNSKSEVKPQILLSIDNIKKAIMSESEKAETELWKYLVLLECSLFQPYFPLDEEDVKNKTYKGLTITQKAQKDSLWNIAAWLGIRQDYIEKFQSQYKKVIKQMSGYWTKVFIITGITAAAAALAVVSCGGSIAALFAAQGLYGAAAISSGLAVLGGGAIAVGGFGMVGGMVVLVGGGLLLGSGIGATAAMALATTNPNAVMHESAKIYVVLKEIVLGIQHDTKRCQEILGTIIDKISEYKKEIARLRQEVEKNKEKIKNLEKSVKYLEKFVKMASA